MQQDDIRRFALVGAAFLFLAHVRADEPLSRDETLCRDWFGASARVSPVATNAAVGEVRVDGRTAGWIFRTDQVPPVCKGKRGEISVLVALGTDARIKGLHVLFHQEDPNYFRRLKSSFFEQFQNRRADAGTDKLDAVTRATFSSKAIIRDVMEGARSVIDLPEVAEKMKSASDCPLTKTAVLSHN